MSEDETHGAVFVNADSADAENSKKTLAGIKIGGDEKWQSKKK